LPVVTAGAGVTAEVVVAASGLASVASIVAGPTGVTSTTTGTSGVVTGASTGFSAGEQATRAANNTEIILFTSFFI
jgi:hypothetical protein